MEDKEIRDIANELADNVVRRLRQEAGFLPPISEEVHCDGKSFSCTGRYKVNGCNIRKHSCQGDFSCRRFDVR